MMAPGRGALGEEPVVLVELLPGHTEEHDVVVLALGEHAPPAAALDDEAEPVVEPERLLVEGVHGRVAFLVAELGEVEPQQEADGLGAVAPPTMVVAEADPVGEDAVPTIGDPDGDRADEDTVQRLDRQLRLVVGGTACRVLLGPAGLCSTRDGKMRRSPAACTL